MSNPSTYAKTTEHITITVEPFYLDEQSEPADSHYVWAYHVRIENNSERAVQLKTRYWRITDSLGNVQEVRGDGVVGEQPELNPGQGFRYSSYAVIATPVGSMHGIYEFQTKNGARFEVPIPAFSLSPVELVH